METKCYFESADGFCTALNIGYCVESAKCKFRQTEAEYHENRDEAIRLNQKHGNCDRCKYRNKGKKCRLKGDEGNGCDSEISAAYDNSDA